MAPAKDRVTDDQDDHTMSALSEQLLDSSHESIVIDPDSLTEDGDVTARLLASMVQARRKAHLIRVTATE